MKRETAFSILSIILCIPLGILSTGILIKIVYMIFGEAGISYLIKIGDMGIGVLNVGNLIVFLFCAIWNCILLKIFDKLAGK